jgi:hypothetical protein
MSAGWWNCSDHHINELELHMVWKACQLLNHHLHNQSVLFRSDNITMVTYLNQMGSCSPHLNQVLQKIVDWARTNNMTYLAVHLAGVENNQANYLSHLFPQHKWRTNHKVFMRVKCQWGPHMINRFTTACNVLLPRFNS